MALYSPNGSLNITVVDGNTLVPLTAADGSMNVVVSDGSAPVGLYHPCGARYVTVADGTNNIGIYAFDGSLAVSESDDHGAMHVTVVSGSLDGGGGNELFIADFENATYSLEGVPCAITDLFEQNADWGSPWNVNHVVEDTGIVVTNGNNSLPAAKAAVNALLLDAGFTVVLDVTFGEFSTATIQAFDAPDFNQTFTSNVGDQEFSTDISFESVSQSAAQPGMGVCKFAITMTEDTGMLVIDGGNATEITPNAAWILTNVGFGFNGDMTVRSIKGYSPMTEAEMQAATI